MAAAKSIDRGGRRSAGGGNSGVSGIVDIGGNMGVVSRPRRPTASAAKQAVFSSATAPGREHRGSFGGGGGSAKGGGVSGGGSTSTFSGGESISTFSSGGGRWRRNFLQHWRGIHRGRILHLQQDEPSLGGKKISMQSSRRTSMPTRRCLNSRSPGTPGDTPSRCDSVPTTVGGDREDGNEERWRQ